MKIAGVTLLPCPWCGGTRLVMGDFAGHFDGHFVACMSSRCHGVMGPCRRTERGAAKAWNRRARG